MSDKSSVSDILEKVFLLGIGAAALTKEKATELVDDLVRRGQISREQGEELLEKATAKTLDETAGIRESVSEAYQDSLRTMGIATNDNVQELERRISVLEAKIYGKPARVEEPDTGFTVTRTEKERPT